MDDFKKVWRLSKQVIQSALDRNKDSVKDAAFELGVKVKNLLRRMGQLRM